MITHTTQTVPWDDRTYTIIDFLRMPNIYTVTIRPIGKPRENPTTGMVEYDKAEIIARFADPNNPPDPSAEPLS